MTSNPDSLFLPVADPSFNEAIMATEAIKCVETFAERFNARDLIGMDALLHFPHVILSGETLAFWDRPGQLPVSFFDDLSASTGWDRSTYKPTRVLLVSPRKVHLLVEYSRDDQAGTPITHHQNVWIVTYDQGRWGIKQRSY